MSLFADQAEAAATRGAPLAVRMRPRTLEEFVGQEHFLGEGRMLRRLLLADQLGSAIFYGPPGCGKTTLARLIAQRSAAAFESLHAAEAGVREVRGVLDAARQRLATGRRTLLFLDEIHRFSRTQQDVLLRDVEEGAIILIGATTENPFHSIVGPLISRSQVFEFQPLNAPQLEALLRRALDDSERGLGGAACDDDALAYIAAHSAGDARRALTALEVAVQSQRALDPAARVTLDVAAEALRRGPSSYDRSGDLHYDITSAFIKSMRGSDPDGALYWLARMLEGGEDPRFIARRIVIAASEDVGSADPQAVILAAACAQATELVGLPECRYALAQAALYVALAPKSDAVTRAITAALREVREQPLLPVPEALRDASYAGAARLGRGGYRTPHADSPPAAQDCLGTRRDFYAPGSQGDEPRLAERLAELNRRRDGGAS